MNNIRSLSNTGRIVKNHIVSVQIPHEEANWNTLADAYSNSRTGHTYLVLGIDVKEQSAKLELTPFENKRAGSIKQGDELLPLGRLLSRECSHNIDGLYR